VAAGFAARMRETPPRAARVNRDGNRTMTARRTS